MFKLVIKINKKTFLSVVLATDVKTIFLNMRLSELFLKMIVKHRTMLELTRTIVRTAIKIQHNTFLSVVLATDVKTNFLNIRLSELCLKITVEHRTMLELTRTIVRTAIKIQHNTFLSVVL